MVWESIYEKWDSFSALDDKVRGALENIKDEQEKEDCFYTNVSFGTGGMRGLLGAGPNRMNIYTVRKAARGLADYVLENGEEAKMRGVVIAYDSRYQSEEFALETAKTLGYAGIKVYLFESLRTTPELSFAVRYLHAFSGVVITASHNPAPYNGFKVYGEDGAQFASAEADKIVAYVNAVEDELTIPVADATELKLDGRLTMIGDNVDQAYLTKLQGLTINQAMIDDLADEVKIVYTPLHGTGNRPVKAALQGAGFQHVAVVAAQAEPDSAFPTVDYPNPEEASAFALAMAEGKEIGADILLATDPDADRVGVAAKVGDNYELLTGNQIGAIILHYLITEKKANKTLADNAVVLKTIVTSELGRDIATRYGLKTVDTLTGFKYIAEKIREYEASGEQSFLFGYEESYGYLIGSFVRDKDAVQTCLLIAEIAAYYKQKGITLYDGLQEIYQDYGYYMEDLHSVTLTGRDGTEKIAEIMEAFRENPPLSLADITVTVREDYANSERIIVQADEVEKMTLPQSNVLKYKLANDAWICVRPSGTEPKIKFYFGVNEKTQAESQRLLTDLKTKIINRVESYIN